MKAEAVICGAGIAGASAAYFLAARHGLKDVLLVDERPPLSLNSDRSSECYRNWWPGPGDAMVRLMNRSIDLMEMLARDSGNAFNLNRRGYLYCSADPSAAGRMQAEAAAISALGAGPLRVHSGGPGEPEYQPHPAESFERQPDGADLLLDPALIRRHFPYLSDKIVAALHVRRAGWLSAQQLGMLLLQRARAAGAQVQSGRVSGVRLSGGRITEIELESGERIAAPVFIAAPGPYLGPVGRLLGLELPVHNELHLKMTVKDALGVLGREAPLVIWNDPLRVDWDEEERQFLEEEPQTRGLLGEMPAGMHTRPEGGPGSQSILALWEYQHRRMEPAWPVPGDELFPETVLRGLEALLPGMRQYRGRAGKPWLDGGYYTKTPENRPLIGPLPVAGAYVLGALSGYGIMAACAAGELLAAHVTGEALPAYASAFAPSRYEDPAYREMLKSWGDSGQL